MKSALIFLFLLLFTISPSPAQQLSSLKGKLIVLDPGHGGTAETDSYRVGPRGEREEWINMRVALILQDLLEKKGAKVLMTRTKDTAVSLAQRARLAVENEADLFLSLHHNATADDQVNFPIVYFHGNATENPASVALGKHIIQALRKTMYGRPTPASLVSDHTIFPKAGTGVLRNSYGIPSVIAEASFFTNPEEELLLQQPEHNHKEAMAYLEALESFFSEEIPAVLEKYSLMKLPIFDALQEAERMNDIAKLWYEDYENAKNLMLVDDQNSVEEAYALFTRSARSFPDSYVARDCHLRRALLLKKMGQHDLAKAASIRVVEFFVEI